MVGSIQYHLAQIVASWPLEEKMVPFTSGIYDTWATPEIVYVTCRPEHLRSYIS